LGCDTYQGIVFFVLGAVMVVYCILGYYYVFSSIISLVSAEFKDSKFVDILEKLIRIREDEEISYNVSYVLNIYFHLVLPCLLLIRANISSVVAILSGSFHIRPALVDDGYV